MNLTPERFPEQFPRGEEAPPKDSSAFLVLFFVIYSSRRDSHGSFRSFYRLPLHRHATPSFVHDVT